MQTQDPASAIAALDQLVAAVSDKVDVLSGKAIGSFGTQFVIAQLNTVLNLLNRVDAKRIRNKSYTVTKYERTVKDDGPSNAYGTKSASGGTTLVGELGRELVVSDGRYYTVGEDGAEFVTLKRGDIVFNHIDTERIFAGQDGVRGAVIQGAAFAYGTAEGPAMAGDYSNIIISGGGSFVGGAASKPGSSTSPKKKTSYKANIEVEADTSNLEESMKDALDKIKEEVERIIGDYEHKIFLTEKNNGNLEDIVAMYKKMQDTVHDYADQYRAKGLDENSDYITDLQKQWWEYEEAIVEAISTAYEEARSLHENDITLLENSLEDAISIGDVGGMREYTDSIIDAKKAMRSLLQEQIKMYRAEGLADNSDEITEAMDLWHDLGTEIEEAAQQIIDSVSDMVDEIQDAYDTLHKAADEYAESGYITVDALQEIISLGPQYLSFLIDENGQLIINEERINAVIKARTEQLAVETALNYVEQIRAAVEAGETATLNNLLYATQATTGATWSLVYANLALAGLNGEQYAAAMRNINALRALSIAAQKSIGKISKDTRKETLESMEKMQEGMEDIVDYVMDMLADRLEQQVDALEEQREAYSDIIDLKKESLEATKEEADYQKSLSEKIKDIAKLQARIDLLKLDDSREAQAERIKLEEELSDLQGELADQQSEKLLETQTDTLDKMQEANEDRIDREIEDLEKTASSYEKRWQQAIAYIESHWSTLHQELLAWNTEYGDVLNSEITDAYNAAASALQKYGNDFSTVLSKIRSEIESLKASMDNSLNTNLGDNYTPSDEELSEAQKIVVGSLLSRMRENSDAWKATIDKDTRAALAQANVGIVNQLAGFGIHATKDPGINASGNWNGEWYDQDGQKLYTKYAAYIYHKGGVVGGGDIKANEQIALLENDEWVLSRKMVENLSAQMERINALRTGISSLTSGLSNLFRLNNFKMNGGDSIHNVTTNNSTPIAITIGDTIISGADQSTIQQHMKVSEDMVNQIARVIGIRR